MILAPAAFFALAAVCAPGLDARMLLVQAQRESGLDTAAIHANVNGSTDYGVMQINSGNFQLLGLRSPAEALDPCRSLQAAQDLYFILSRYNSGRPTASLGYASAIVDGTHGVTPEPVEATATAACSPPDPTGWRVVASPARCQAGDDAWHTTPHPKD